MKNNSNIKMWGNHKRKPTQINKTQLKASAVIGLILMVVLLLTHLLPPLYVAMNPGEYERIAEGEWIAAGENALEGRFFKIDAYSYLSGFPASHFEVYPVGFPVSCCFVENIWVGNLGVYVMNLMWFAVDFFVMWMLVLAVVVAFGYYEQNKKPSKKTASKKPSLLNKIKKI